MTSKFSLFSYLLPFLHPTVAGEDYEGVADVPLAFIRGQRRSCHTVTIIQDDNCEIDENEMDLEDFFSNLEYASGIMPIRITRPRTRVIIDDTNEPECGK